MKDLVVIGAGMAGIAAARRSAEAGWKTAIVDALPYGGTCALRGCDPKKMLRRGAEIIDAARLMAGKGIAASDLRIDWQDLMAHKRSFTDPVPENMENGLARAGVETLHGAVRFVDGTTLEFDDGGRVESRHFLIAAGAKPRPLNIPGEAFIADNAGFLELEELPRRIVFVGGGFISFEFTHIAVRAGAQVTILIRSDRALRGFDPDLVDLLVDRTTGIGVDIRFETDLLSVTRSDGGYDLVLTRGGTEERLSCDLVVHGAGRVPAIDDLALDAAGVERTAAGVKVHPHLQSVSAANVWAAGDAADTVGAPLTPVAVFEGKVAVSNLLKGTERAPEYGGVPTAVFTVPELVRVGLLESEAREQGLDFQVKFTDTSGWFSQRRIGETHAAAKIILETGTGRILGAHLFGPEYAEVVNILGLAIRLGLGARDVKRMVAAYPTAGSDLGSLL